MDEKQFEDIYLPNTQITNAFVNLNLLLCLRNLVRIVERTKFSIK